MLALQLAADCRRPDLLEVGELPTGPMIYLPRPAHRHSSPPALPAHLNAEERQAVADGLLIQPLIGSLPNIMAQVVRRPQARAEGRRLMVLDTLRRFHIEEENASGPGQSSVAWRPSPPIPGALSCSCTMPARARP
ncbi:helicase RepA family protein [Escherichia coli]|uniref:helicase RepA family protein n=1 Tax=Escherichia coli TaxID=562 RepID=UPI00202314E0|nr:helicase RepA family protein [Escherichia coli]